MFQDHINDIGDPRRYAVFCVARIGSQIYDSTLLEPMDRHSTDLTLPDVFLFSKIPSYFEMTLEVYSHLLDKELGTGMYVPTGGGVSSNDYARVVAIIKNINNNFNL